MPRPRGRPKVPVYKIVDQPPLTVTERLVQLALDLHLTSLQKRFAEALAADPNANKGDAFQKITGEENRIKACRRGTTMFGSKKVRRYYRAIMDSAGPVADRSRMRIMQAWEIRGRLSEIARADYKDFVRINPAGGFEFDLQGAIAAGKSWLIEDLSHDPETGAPRVKLYSAKDALKTLAKIEGLMQESAPPQPAAVTNRTLVLNILSQPDARRLLDDLGQRVLTATAVESAMDDGTTTVTPTEPSPDDPR